MRLLELFSGVNHSIGKVAQTLGWEVISVDINPKAKPDLLLDILDFDETTFEPTHFSFIWASPPCESYSQARTVAKIPRDEAMEKADKLVSKTRQIIDYFGCNWAIENPAYSRMWKREVSRGLEETSDCVTSYCSFGSQYRKNTRIANSFGLQLPRCPGAGLCPAMVGKRHLEAAQRGGGGVTGRPQTLDELHSIPSELCRTILTQATSHCASAPFLANGL